MTTILVFILLAFGPILLDMRTRRTGPESLARAVEWSGIYVASAMVFALYLDWFVGRDQSALFISAWAVEKALSVDNLMVFSAVFLYFGVKPEYQHRVLHYGIIGSAVLRLAFVAVGMGAAFLFGRVLDFAFGVFVIYTATQILKGGDVPEIDHAKRWYVRWAKKVFRVSTNFTVGQFFMHIELEGRRYLAVTPLLFCLIAMEITDIAFAFDSVPAVIGLTRSLTIGYAAIMFAVVGLRSLYFVLDALRRYTVALGRAVSAVLGFVGSVMIVRGVFNVQMAPRLQMVVVVSVLAGGIVVSAWSSRKVAA